MSIVPPASQDKSIQPNSLRGVGEMMTRSTDPFTYEVGHLVGYIGHVHEHPVACAECRDGEGPCFEIDAAHSIAFAWLLKVVEERG